MRAYWILPCLLLVACGGRVAAEATAGDAGVDSSRVDTGVLPPPPLRDTGTPLPPRDVGPDPTGCAERLGPTFMCTSPEPARGGTVCTDVMIQAVVDGCFGDSASATTCSAAQKKFPACGRCMLNEWIIDGRLAIAQCIQRIDPASSCAGSVQCTYDCLDDVCAACDDFEVEECWSNEAEGQCAAQARDYTTCISDPKFSVCYPSTVADVLPFYRGACRDGANWSRAYEPDTVDAGTGG